jgi:hypothetical protein
LLLKSSYQDAKLRVDQSPAALIARGGRVGLRLSAVLIPP